MRSGRMPISIAAARSSATANSLLPMVEWVSKMCSATVSAIAMTPPTSCATGKYTPAKFTVPASQVCGSDTKFAEKM